MTGEEEEEEGFLLKNQAPRVWWSCVVNESASASSGFQNLLIGKTPVSYTHLTLPTN